MSIERWRGDDLFAAPGCGVAQELRPSADTAAAGLTKRDYCVWAHLASVCAVEGACHDSLDTIAQECGMGGKAVRRALKVLIERGFVERRAGVNHYTSTFSHVVVQPVPPPTILPQSITTRASDNTQDINEE